MAQNLYNANDGLTGRDGGPYLDLEEAREAEVKRAVVEDREPDLENPPAGAGIQLVTAGQALANAGVINTPSQANNPDAAEAAMQGVVDDDRNSLKAHSVLADEPEVKDESEEDVFEDKKPAKKTAASK